MLRSIILSLAVFFSFSAAAQDCVDLGGIDFGDCEMAMGVALIDGECTYISGCGWQVGGVDYSPYSFVSVEDCEACFGADCMDVGGIDFGLCDMAMGFALVNGVCTSVSGCGWEVGGIDYSPFFYENISDCEACLTSDCFDMMGVDFGLCQVVLGIGLINGTCSYISGCSWVANNTDYSVYAFETMEECQATCLVQEDCFDLGGIDFGPCDAVMGVGIINGSCVEISGCGWEVGGVNYGIYSFDSIDDCTAQCAGCFDPDLIGQEECVWGDTPEPVCGCDGKTYWNACVAMYEYGIAEYTEGYCSCPDPAIIDPQVLCTALYDPVCGCDGVTYSNSCFAWYASGITEWIPGECTNSVGETTLPELTIWPIPSGDLLNITIDRTVAFEVLDASGRVVIAGSLVPGQHTLNVSAISEGIYLFRVFDGKAQTTQRFIR